MESTALLLLTKDGYTKLENELMHLRGFMRKKIAEQLKDALSFGDIVDNNEYEDAKNSQAFVEGRIITIEKMLRSARILETDDHNGHNVAIGSTVKLRNLETNMISVYSIVSTVESDPSENKISDLSPLGEAILGLEVGDQAEVKAPAGKFYYQIEDLHNSIITDRDYLSFNESAEMAS